MDAHDATTTHYCKFPGCTKEARSSVGRYAYCEEHRDREARGLPPSPANGKPSTRRATGLAATIAALAKDAKAVDTARAKASKLTEKALAAKQHADTLQAQFERKLREATGAANSHERSEASS